MAITLASILVLWWCGHAACQKIAGYSNSRIDVFISWGLGLSLSATALILWFAVSPFSLSIGSWLILSIGVYALIRRAFRVYLNIQLERRVLPVDISPIKVGLLLLVALHIALVVIAHIAADIFPWDAFTTWMYRAKAWVLSNASIPLTPTAEWFSKLTATYPAEAAHYPISVSAIAAFASTITGGWDSTLASVPWLCVNIASGALMLGLCRQISSENRLVPVIGMALLLTTPLLHIHSMLAGYADIWVQATSGMGLASLCVWSQKRTKASLIISVALLCLGTVFKFEGWLWLGIGFLSIVIISGGLKALVITMLLILLICASISWGASFLPTTVGTWGYSDSTLFFGPLGAIALRPINPVGYLVNETILRGNYLLLFPLYILCIGWSIICGKRMFFGYWLIGFLALGALLIIFSLSGYSVYTELGTALNRLILQILPIFVVSIVAISSDFNGSGSELKKIANREKPPHRILARLLVISTLTIVIAIVLLPIIWHSTAVVVEKKYPASEFTSVGGAFSHTESGYKFTDKNVVIGVAKVNVTPDVVQPRYVHLHADIKHRDSLSFYWINALDSRVHSLPITVSGKTLLDMSQYADFWQLPISEMGYLAAPVYFEGISIHSLGQSQSLRTSHSALINLWRTPAQLGQQTINGIDGNSPSPINFNAVLVFALLLLLLAAIIETSWMDTPTIFTRAHTMVAIAGIWLAGSTLYLQQAAGYAADLQQPIWSPAAERDHPLSSLQQEAIDAIGLAVKNWESQNEIHRHSTSTEARSNVPVLIAGDGTEGRYLAHKLPFALLPLKAAKIELSQLLELPENTPALLVFLSSEDTPITNLSSNKRISLKQINSESIASGELSLWRIQTQ